MEGGGGVGLYFDWRITFDNRQRSSSSSLAFVRDLLLCKKGKRNEYEINYNCLMLTRTFVFTVICYVYEPDDSVYCNCVRLIFAIIILFLCESKDNNDTMTILVSQE